jgi:predicted ABC-type transport system involved in lysophospholipase L1 biosynthesis ATPase subunit
LDALENVCLPARMARKPADAVAARGRTLLERVGLKERIEHKPYELSGGEQQRVAIARALINEPEVILADEPTGNLDSHTGEAIIGLLLELRTEQKSTLVIATHDLKLAARAPRVIELVDGQIQGSQQLVGTS